MQVPWRAMCRPIICTYICQAVSSRQPMSFECSKARGAATLNGVLHTAERRLRPGGRALLNPKLLILNHQGLTGRPRSVSGS